MRLGCTRSWKIILLFFTLFGTDFQRDLLECASPLEKSPESLRDQYKIRSMMEELGRLRLLTNHCKQKPQNRKRSNFHLKCKNSNFFSSNKRQLRHNKVKNFLVFLHRTEVVTQKSPAESDT